MYVWFDALTTTSPRSTTPTTARSIERYWRESPEPRARHRQGHHALPRRLLARDAPLGAGPLPTTVLVHGYVTLTARR